MTFLFTSLFVLVPLIWLPWTSELFEFNKLMLTYIISILIGATWAIKCILAKKIIFKRTILDIPILLFLISNLLSLIFSIDMHTSWYGYYSRWNGGLLSLLTYAFLYWAYVSTMSKKNTLDAIRYSLVTAVIISVYASLEHFGHSASCFLVTGSFDVSCWVQDVQNRVYATMGQPNWLAAYLVALIFVPLANFQFSKSNFQRIFNATIFILLFLTLLFTKSRSGLLAFGISSVVFWGLNFGKKSIIPMIIFAFSVLGLTFVFQNPIRDMIFKPTVVTKIVGTALETGGTESGEIRKIVWKGAINIWLGNVKNFMIGAGPETFAQAYYQYRPIEHNNTSEWELLYNKAHNEFLNQLATTGILGFVAYILLLMMMLKTFGLKNIALLAGWITISITNFWGFSVVVTQLLLFLLPAMAITLYDK
ncbi:MAG: O-antigen ligase family protein [Candidatus Amesbacteria bacterium]|nr:O-antigen ligase family protein [Candidatus Amesbacteria bacterium]